MKWEVDTNPETGWFRITCPNCEEDVTEEIRAVGFLPDINPLWDFCPYCGHEVIGIAAHVCEEDRRGAPIQGALGGTQETTIINESGMYSLILSSKLSRLSNNFVK